MASISSPGIGSGLDVTGIVASLMEVESRPLLQLDQKEAGYQAEISSLGLLKSSLSSLQSALQSLKDVATFQATAVTSSDTDVLTVSSTAGTLPASYDVTVNRLAQRHKLGSDPFASTATFGGIAGDQLNITAGTQSFALDLSTAMTLEQIQQAINDEANTTGVSAGLITGDGGEQTLVLSAAEEGFDNRVQLSFGGAIDTNTFGFDMLNLDAAGDPLGSEAELDASITVDGVAVTRSSNTISDAVSGLTLSLKGVGSATASISQDQGVATAAVNAFIDAFNEAKGAISSLSEGELSGSSVLRSIDSLLRGGLNHKVSESSGFQYLAQLGVTSNEETGALNLDAAALSDALNGTEESVITFFTDENNGFATNLDGVLDGILESGGLIDSSIDSKNSSIDQLNDRRESLLRRLASTEARYLNQFGALDTLMAQFNTTSAFLTSQLDNLSNLFNNRNDN